MRRLLLLVFVLLSACHSSGKFERILTDTTGDRYWVRKYMDSNGKYKDLWDRVQFSSDGSAIFYHSNSENDKGHKFISIEGNIDPTWNFNEKDSTFKIGCLIYKVIKFSRDSIIMEGKGYKGNFAFINAKPITLKK